MIGSPIIWLLCTTGLFYLILATFKILVGIMDAILKLGIWVLNVIVEYNG